MSDDMKREALRKKLLEQRAVEDHWLNGGEVEVGTKNGTSWIDVPNPGWSWHEREYRIKPKPREYWAAVRADGSAYATSSNRDIVENFIHNDTQAKYRLVHMREVVE